MTNRTLTALMLRIAGILLFIKIFDQFTVYFFSTHALATMSLIEELFNEPVDELYVTGAFLMIANIVVSLFLFIKAEWVSKKNSNIRKRNRCRIKPKFIIKSNPVGDRNYLVGKDRIFDS